jgi:hypothetical protein
VPTKTATAVGGNAQPSGTVVTADGNVVVVVDVVVVVKGATQPTTGTVLADGSDDGGHNTGTDVVVVVALDATIGDTVMNAAANNGTTNRERRIFHTLLMQNTPQWAPEQRY